MNSPQTREEKTTRTSAGRIDTKLEIVILPVSDVDRARRFYEGLGWRLDADFAPSPDFRVVQLTPPGSPCSIIFGTGITSAAPGSVQALILVVDDVQTARAELVARGADVSDVFHDAAGVFPHAGGKERAPGPDPKGRSYFTWASFRDPDGNGWLLQQVKTRLPGRVTNRGLVTDTASLTELLQETEKRHGAFEATAPKHAWSQWYAAYIVAREHGRTPDEAASDAALPHERGQAVSAAARQRPPELLGQTVVVIGGSAGIGLETVRRARLEGADVIATGRNAERLRQAAREVGATSTAAFDAEDPAALAQFFGGLPGKIDHVMVTAGRPTYGRLVDMDVEAARRALDEHPLLMLKVARAAAGKVKPGGTLIFMGGTGGRHPALGTGAASTVTAALPALTASLALELAPVRVNLIAAGFVDTPLSASLLGADLEKRRAQLRSTLPIRRVVQPTDVAALAVHLMTNTALTGATFDVDGGQQLVAGA